MARPKPRKRDDGQDRKPNDEHDRRLDDTVADSFPASDPPSHTGITGVGGRGKPKSLSSEDAKLSSHHHGSDAEPR